MEQQAPGTPGQAGEDRSPGPRVPSLGETDLHRIQAGLRQVAHTHDRMRELLNAVLTISSELDLRLVLYTIVDTARELVQARYAALGVLNEAGEFIDLITSGPGTEQCTVQDGGRQLPHGTGLLGDLVRHRQPLRVEDLSVHPRAAGFPAGHPVMTTLLGAPITVRGTVYGNLYLSDKTSGAPFVDADEEMVIALAGAAGVAIENARLYERVRQATEDFQRRLLPEMPRIEGVQLQARYLPATEVPRIGGDWYDLIHLPDGVPCLMVGDVMGHDVHAASMMSRISNMLRVIAFDVREPPSSILRHLDEVLHQLHGGSPATVVVARLEPAEHGRRLWWSCAGHLPPLLVGPDHQARYLHRGDTGLPLGVDPGLSRPDHEEPLPLGSTVLLHTDGLVEEPGRAIDDGMHPCARIAAALATAALPRLCDALLVDRGGSFRDDVALLAARVTA